MLKLTLPSSELPRFNAVFQRGVAMTVPAKRSVYTFLSADLALDAAYIRQRITTVFLDGQVVDVLEKATLAPGSVLALSAAMPGLVGATLRRSGHYAAMRAAITRSADRASSARGAGASKIRVKLFNLLMEELGPVLLARGIQLEERAAMELLGPPLAISPASPDGGERELEIQVRLV